MTIQKLFTAETITYYNFISSLEQIYIFFLELIIASFLHLFEFSLYPLLSVFITFHGFSIQFSIFELNEVISQILVFPWRCPCRTFSTSCFNLNGVLYSSLYLASWGLYWDLSLSVFVGFFASYILSFSFLIFFFPLISV